MKRIKTDYLYSIDLLGHAFTLVRMQIEKFLNTDFVHAESNRFSIEE